jgi:hypothetical protein
MSLVELIAQADERGLAASGLACLDRCVPLLGGDDEILRPLWASLAESEGRGEGEGWGEDWGERVEQARAKLDGPGVGAPGGGGSPRGRPPCSRIGCSVPFRWTGVRGAFVSGRDACSVAALQIHRLLDAASDGASSVTARREGRTQDMSPLVAAELRRQVAILEVLSAHGPAGLRQALALSTEGRRVLRAVVSRRARGRV